jgi:hypothetical protein
MHMITAAFIVLFTLVLSADGQGTAKVKRSVSVDLDFSRKPIPAFQSGFLIGRETSPPGFSIWNASGALVGRREIILPGASAIVVIDVSVSPDGGAPIRIQI